MLNIRLFGPGSARSGERAVARFPNQRPHLLLCYLALNRGQRHAREVLAALFWGDCPTPISRKYLRNALWRLRRALLEIGIPVEHCLQIGDSAVSLADDAPVDLDTEQFEASVTRYRHLSGPQLTPDAAEELERAAALYAGDLLEGVYEDWCIYERERFFLMHLRTLHTLLDYHEANGAYRRALEHGERILACDETQEKAHRQMMRLHYLSGNRAAALAQYHRCEQTMRHVLHLPPMDETQSLYDQIVRDDLASVNTEQLGRSGIAGHDTRRTQDLDQAVRRLSRLEAQLDQVSQELRSVATLIRSLSRDDTSAPSVPQPPRGPA